MSTTSLAVQRRDSLHLYVHVYICSTEKHYVYDSVCFDCFPQDLDDEALRAEPLIFSHFASGIGEPKYLPVSSWESLSKTLEEALEAYNEINAVMNLVLFEDAMYHVYVRIG